MLVLDELQSKDIESSPKKYCLFKLIVTISNLRHQRGRSHLHRIPDAARHSELCRQGYMHFGRW